MRPYLAIFRARFLTLFQYAMAAIAGIGTQVFWGLIYTMILAAFYDGKDVHAMTLSQAITFIWINQALLQLVPWNIDKELESQIRTGNVAYDLVRPLDLYWHWFSRALSLRTIPTTMRAIPLFLISGLFLDLSAPVTIAAGAIFVLSLVLAALVAASITTITLLSLFWTISGDGIVRLMPHIASLLSGLVVPLPLFPDWMQPLLSIQPFRCVLDIPSRIYTGIIPTHEAFWYLALQIAWAGIIIVFGKWLANRAIYRVVIQGG